MLSIYPRIGLSICTPSCVIICVTCSNAERIARKINELIVERSKSHPKLVVAIDGYAGSGKTTVADFISKQNTNVLVIHLDDFIRHWKDRKEMIEKSEDKPSVFEYNLYRYEDLE